MRWPAVRRKPSTGSVRLRASCSIHAPSRLRVDRCGKFGPDYARRLKRRQGRLGDTWFLDEVFVTINGQRQYLWRAVDQDGDLIDLLVQPRRDGRAARRFSDNSCRVSDRNRCGS